MNIRLENYFGIKNFLGEKIKPSPLKFGRNNNTKKNIIIQKFLSKSPLIKNILPKINRLNSLNETKGFSKKNLLKKLKITIKFNKNGNWFPKNKYTKTKRRNILF